MRLNKLSEGTLCVSTLILTTTSQLSRHLIDYEKAKGQDHEVK